MRVWLFYWIPAFETVQKTSLGYAGGKPNPLNPPYQGDFPLNSPLIRGARGVKNDERWVSCTVSIAMVDVWKGIGFWSLFLAAEIDGAGATRRLFQHLATAETNPR